MKLRRMKRLGSNEAGAVAVEYALIGAILGLGLLSALNNLKGNLNGNYKRVASAIYTGTLPTAPWLTSTYVNTTQGTLLGYPATVQNYKNNDGTTRNVMTITDPTQAASVTYSSLDQTLDANGNVIFRSIAVNKGDYGTPAPVVDSNFVYTGPQTFTYVETSADPNGWAWSSHKDSVVNGNLVSQLVTNKDGGVYQTNFGLSPSGVNRLNSVNYYNSSGGIAYTNNYNYDSSGNLVSVTKA